MQVTGIFCSKSKKNCKNDNKICEIFKFGSAFGSSAVRLSYDQHFTYIYRQKNELCFWCSKFLTNIRKAAALNSKRKQPILFLSTVFTELFE